MASETGHAKNLANFEALLTAVQSFGAIYNPPRNDLKLTALQTMTAPAQAAIVAVNNKSAVNTAAIKAREDAFEDLSKLVTRVLSALYLTPAVDLIGDNARTLARKIRGERAAPVPDPPATLAPGEEPPTTVSVSQMSYDNRLANFEAFVQLLESQPSYAPNETDLNTVGLRTRLEDMRAKNTAAVTARINRNRLLYYDHGIIDTANDVKTYVKSALGADSPQYGQIKDLIFKKVNT